MSGVPFRGVSAGQDTRFTDKERKLLKSMKFPKEYSLKVDVKKVNWEIMREWTALRVTQLLGMEDEVLIGYIHEQLGEDKKNLDPKMLQIALTGFLEKNTSLFVKELWTLLASASEHPTGIPQKILDDKAEELRIKNEAQKAITDRLTQEREKKAAAAKEAAAARSKAGESSAPDKADTHNNRQAQNGETRNRDRGRDNRGDRDRPDDRDQRDRPPGRFDRAGLASPEQSIVNIPNQQHVTRAARDLKVIIPSRPSERDADRGREYDRRRGLSPVRPIRSMRDDRDRGYDRNRGYNRSPGRHDRGRDRGGLGRDRSPVLKKARYGRSRSPGRRSSRSPARDDSNRRRSSRSPERERAGGEQEGKRDLKALHSTFAKAEGETVLPDKAEHLILPPKRVDTAFPLPASERHRDSAECDADMADADVVPADGGKKPKKDKKEKKEKKDKKEKKKHKKEKKDRMQEHDKDVGSSDEDAQAGRSADDRRRFEEDLRQKALQSTRKTESSDD